MSKSQKIRQQERQRVLAELGKKSLQTNNSPDSTGHEQQRVIAAGFVQTEMYSGPLPHPDMLKQYEEAVPGLAQVIVHQFSEQGTHRRWLEKTNMIHATGRSWAGLACGLVVALAGLWAAVQLGGWAGAVLGAIDLVGLVGVFVYGSLGQRQERQARAETLAKRK
jgi:uncharacterized membrane protein